MNTKAEQPQEAVVLQGVMQQQNAKPAFTVRKLTGTQPKTIHMFDKEKKKIVSKVIQIERGYMVTFSKGHSIHCVDKAALDAVGAGATLVPLITEDGEQVGAVRNTV